MDSTTSRPFNIKEYIVTELDRMSADKDFKRLTLENRTKGLKVIENVIFGYIDTLLRKYPSLYFLVGEYEQPLRELLKQSLAPSELAWRIIESRMYLDWKIRGFPEFNNFADAVSAINDPYLQFSVRRDGNLTMISLKLK